jgi:hypothetical protein
MKLLPFLLILLFFCKKPEPSKMEEPPKESPHRDFVIVVNSVGNSKIRHLDNSEEKAKIGSVIRTGDLIETFDQSRLTLQFSNSILKFYPNTHIYVRDASFVDSKISFKIEMYKGILLGKIKEFSKNDRYTFLTSSLVNEMNNSHFVLQESKNKVSIKTYSGVVKAYPRFLALKDKNPTVYIEGDIEFPLASQILKMTQGLTNNQLLVFLSSDTRFKNEFITKEEFITYSKWLSNLHFKPKSFKIHKKELSEFNTMQLEDDLIVLELINIYNEFNKQNPDLNRSEELEARRSSLENQILKNQNRDTVDFVKEENFEPKKNRKKIKKNLLSYYERIERIKLKNGRIEIGAILSQENGMIIMYTENGILRIPHDDILEVLYDYQKQVK